MKQVMQTRKCIVCDKEYQTNRWNKINCSYQCAKKSYKIKHATEIARLDDEDRKLYDKLMK